MRRAPKKVRERYWCERLKILLPGFPTGNITGGENPDWRVDSPEAIIGIEMTEVCDKQVEEQLILRSRILDQAQRLFSETHNSPLHVSVLFSDHHPLRKREVSSLAEKLYDFVAKVLPNGSAMVELQHQGQNYANLPCEFDKVVLYRFPDLHQHSWSDPCCAYLQEITPQTIQAIIAKKEHRIPAYRIQCNLIWLLIIIDGFRLSSMASVPQLLAHFHFKSSFDRLFLLRDRDHLLELKKDSTCTPAII